MVNFFQQGDIVFLDFDPRAGHEQRGRPVSKVQMLANYLGVTTSELLGEVPMGAYSKSEAEITQADIKPSKAEQSLLHSFRQMNADGQERVAEYSSALLASGRYSSEGGGEKPA